MNPNLLREIALIGGGKVLVAGLEPADLVELYYSEIAAKERRIIDAASTERPVEHFRWFVLLALILLASEMLIRDREVST